MAGGHENLIPFDKRTEDEQREIAKKGGKASGEARRKKADFMRTLNAVLPIEVEVKGLSDMLRANGVDSTYESIVNMAIIQKAMAGDVRAYEAIAKYSGQVAGTDADVKEQELKLKGMELDNAEKEMKTATDESGGLASAIMEAYERRKRGESDA